jgi:DNA-directed RNA polymerase subunit RPC12/RpoP
MLITDHHRRCQSCGKPSGTWPYDHERKGHACPHCGAIQVRKGAA